MSQQILSDLETLFAALADKTRLRLLNLMRDGEVCVCFFTEVLGESQPKISRHLAYLRKAGLVQARRDGKWMHYSISFPDEEKGKSIVEEALRVVGAQQEFIDERNKLVRVCLSGNVPVTIQNAPKPDAVVVENEKVEEFEEAEEMETYLL